MASTRASPKESLRLAPGSVFFPAYVNIAYKKEENGGRRELPMVRCLTLTTRANAPSVVFPLTLFFKKE